MFIEIWTGQSRSKLDTEIATQKRAQDVVMAESDEIDVPLLRKVRSAWHEKIILAKDLGVKIGWSVIINYLKYMPNKHCLGLMTQFDDCAY